MEKLKAIWKKDPGLVVSGGAHALAFVFLIANFSWAPTLEDHVESVPVEMITSSDLNQIMNGERTAKQMPAPQRRVDKLAEVEEHTPAPPLAEAKKDTPPPPAPEKANDDPGDDDKPTVKSAAAPPPPTPPERPVEAKPVPQPPARPVETAEAAPPKADPVKPPPQDAEAIEPPPRPKDEPKKVEKKIAKHPPKKPVPRPVEEAKEVPEPPKPPERPEKPDLRKRTLDQVAKLLDSLKPEDKPAAKQRSGNEAKDAKHSDFSFDKIAAAIDHEAPQHRASTGRQLTHLASLGLATAHADKLSPSLKADIDNWLVDHYLGCWDYFGYQKGYVPVVRVQVGPDGSMLAQPELMNPPNDPNFMSLASSAITAVKKCDPLPIPDRFKGHDEAWRDRKIHFNLADKT